MGPLLQFMLDRWYLAVAAVGVAVFAGVFGIQALARRISEKGDVETSDDVALEQTLEPVEAEPVYVPGVGWVTGQAPLAPPSTPVGVEPLPVEAGPAAPEPNRTETPSEVVDTPLEVTPAPPAAATAWFAPREDSELDLAALAFQETVAELAATQTEPEVFDLDSTAPDDQADDDPEASMELADDGVTPQVHDEETPAVATAGLGGEECEPGAGSPLDERAGQTGGGESTVEGPSDAAGEPSPPVEGAPVGLPDQDAIEDGPAELAPTNPGDVPESAEWPGLTTEWVSDVHDETSTAPDSSQSEAQEDEGGSTPEAAVAPSFEDLVAGTAEVGAPARHQRRRWFTRRSKQESPLAETAQAPEVPLVAAETASDAMELDPKPEVPAVQRVSVLPADRELVWADPEAAELGQAYPAEPDAAAVDRCTGARDCPAATHVHGCYADRGSCDDPSDHEVPDVAGSADEAADEGSRDGRELLEKVADPTATSAPEELDDDRAWDPAAALTPEPSDSGHDADPADSPEPTDGSHDRTSPVLLQTAGQDGALLTRRQRRELERRQSGTGDWLTDAENLTSPARPLEGEDLSVLPTAEHSDEDTAPMPARADAEDIPMGDANSQEEPEAAADPQAAPAADVPAKVSWWAARRQRKADRNAAKATAKAKATDAGAASVGSPDDISSAPEAAVDETTVWAVPSPVDVQVPMWPGMHGPNGSEAATGAAEADQVDVEAASAAVEAEVPGPELDEGSDDLPWPAFPEAAGSEHWSLTPAVPALFEDLTALPEEPVALPDVVTGPSSADGAHDLAERGLDDDHRPEEPALLPWWMTTSSSEAPVAEVAPEASAPQQNPEVDRTGLDLPPLPELPELDDAPAPAPMLGQVNSDEPDAPMPGEVTAPPVVVQSEDHGQEAAATLPALPELPSWQPDQGADVTPAPQPAAPAPVVLQPIIIQQPVLTAGAAPTVAPLPEQDEQEHQPTPPVRVELPELPPVAYVPAPTTEQPQAAARTWELDLDATAAPEPAAVPFQEVVAAPVTQPRRRGLFGRRSKTADNGREPAEAVVEPGTMTMPEQLDTPQTVGEPESAAAPAEALTHEDVEAAAARARDAELARRQAEQDAQLEQERSRRADEARREADKHTRAIQAQQEAARKAAGRQEAAERKAREKAERKAVREARRTRLPASKAGPDDDLRAAAEAMLAAARPVVPVAATRSLEVPSPAPAAATSAPVNTTADDEAAAVFVIGSSRRASADLDYTAYDLPEPLPRPLAHD